MGSVLDIFRKDAFGVVSLTASINKLPYLPTRVGDMGLYTEKGINTTFAFIEERDGKLYLLRQKARGTMEQTTTVGLRKGRGFTVPHIPDNQAVLADEVQNLRQFGSTDQLESIANHVNDRLQAAKFSMDATMEFMRVQSLQGVLLDGDASTTIFNWFTEFGLSQTVMNVDFTNFNPFSAPGPLTATAQSSPSGSLSAGAYLYQVTFVTSTGETAAGTASGSITATSNQSAALTNIPIGPAGTLYRNIYRTKAGGSVYYFDMQITDNVTTTATDKTADASLSSTVAPVSSNIGIGQSFASVMDMKRDVATPLIRNIEDALGATYYQNIRVLCGNSFWDNFVSHPSVAHAYERWLQAGDTGTGGTFFRRQQRQQLNRQADDVPPGGFYFAGIYWENYRGHIGSTYYIPSKQAIAFPEGVPDLFIEHYAPAPFIETVNTIGLKYYAKQQLMKWDLGIELHTETNYLPIPTRPMALVSLVQTKP